MFGKYMLEILRTILLEILGGEPIGIIRFESQLIMAVYAYAKQLLIFYLPTIIVIIAIIYMLNTAVFNRGIGHRPRAGGLHRFIGMVFRVLVNILFAWVFLIYGAIVGQIVNHNDEGEEDENTHRGEENARITYTRNIHNGRVWRVVHSFTRLSLHFNLGRGLFRIFYYLLGFIPRVRDNERVRTIIARVLALAVILWGVWKIPLDWTT